MGTPPVLYGITDDSFMSSRILCEKVEAALRGGAKWIQYRDKSNDKKKRFSEATQLLEICGYYGGLLIINDDIELTKKVRADGVHLGLDDTPLNRAREYLGSRFIIGATCHNSIELAAHAQQQGADYLAFGRFFPSKTKSQAAQADLNILKTASESFRLPVIAIGGINIDNAKTALKHGASTIAVCRALFDCNDVTLRAQQFLNL